MINIIYLNNEQPDDPSCYTHEVAFYIFADESFNDAQLLLRYDLYKVAGMEPPAAEEKSFTNVLLNGAAIFMRPAEKLPLISLHTKSHSEAMEIAKLWADYAYLKYPDMRFCVDGAEWEFQRKIAEHIIYTKNPTKTTLSLKNLSSTEKILTEIIQNRQGVSLTKRTRNMVEHYTLTITGSGNYHQETDNKITKTLSDNYNKYQPQMVRKQTLIYSEKIRENDLLNISGKIKNSKNSTKIKI